MAIVQVPLEEQRNDPPSKSLPSGPCSNSVFVGWRVCFNLCPSTESEPRNQSIPFGCGKFDGSGQGVVYVKKSDAIKPQAGFNHGLQNRALLGPLSFTPLSFTPPPACGGLPGTRTWRRDEKQKLRTGLVAVLLGSPANLPPFHVKKASNKSTTVSIHQSSPSQSRLKGFSLESNTLIHPAPSWSPNQMVATNGSRSSPFVTESFQNQASWSRYEPIRKHDQFPFWMFH